MIEVLKQALESMKKGVDGQTSIEMDDAITSLRQAIAGLESQEPVATVTSETGADITMSWWHEPALPVGTKLFTHPPQRTWVGLTDEEVVQCQQGNIYHFYRCIEAKLKEKNNVAQETNS
jgi:hypothetical protein